VHVKPSRTRGRIRRGVLALVKYALGAVVVGYAAYRGGSVVMQADVLRVDRVVVQGNHRLSHAEVMSVLKGLRGEHIVWTDLPAWRQRLLASPWVRDAALRRSLPSTIEVLVSEREPMAIGRIDADLYLIDERGSVIANYGPAYADLDLPIVDGLGGKGSANQAERAALAARVIGSLGQDPIVARMVSQVDVSNARNAAVILSDDPAVIYVGEDRFLSRLQAYLGLAAALRERVPEIDYVDLRFDDRIYVRPVSAKGRKRTVSR
jgi:cell division protein FtsQ